MKPKVLAAVVAGLLVIGGGAFALRQFMAPADDAAIDFVPEDAIGYMNVFIRPSNDQKRALDGLLRKFPGIESTDDAIEKITEALDEAMAQDGMDYEEDLEPWLGSQVAAFLARGGTPALPSFAFLVESKDDEAAQDFVDEVAELEEVTLEDKTYEGETYQMDRHTDAPFAVAILDGFLVAGTEDAVKQTIDTRAGEETLEDDEDFTEAVDPLADDWIGLFYLDTGAFFDDIVAAGIPPEERAAYEAFGIDDQRPQAAILYASPEAVTFEGTGGFDPAAQFSQLTELAGAPGLVPELPEETWGAFGIPKMGRFFDGLFEAFAGLPGFDRSQIDAMFYAQTGLRLEEDVLSWMEDAGVFIQGTNIQTVGGGLVIESGDPGKTAGLVEKLKDLLVQQGIRPEPESRAGLEGFSVQIPGVPSPIYALGGERLVIAYGDDAADAAAGEGPRLRESEAFRAAQDAVGDDFNISFYVDVDAAQAFGEAVSAFSGAPMDTYEEEVKPYLDVLSHMVLAAKTDGDALVQKFVIGVEE